MRISYLIDGLGVGGKEKQLFYLLKECSKEYSIQVIIFSSNIFIKEIRDLPIELIIIEKEKRYKLVTIGKIYKLLMNFKPSIIHTWDNISHILVLPYVFINDVKIINGSIRYGGDIERNTRSDIVKYIAFYTSDVIIGNSRKGISVEHLENKKNVLVIYNGINIDNIQRYNKNLSRKLYGDFIFYDYSIVMIARFHPPKDYITFIKAAKIILSEYSNITFYCIGDGPLQNAAIEEAGKWIGKNIIFLDKRSDLREMLACFDIGVMLNNTKGHAEGISNAIMEYMAAGLPVIATNAGGTPELVINEVTGFLVPPFDEEIVAEKIKLLIHERLMRLRMGIHGREIIKSRFSLDRMISSYKYLYTTLNC
jgi:glycosyltransferase involved in cell wall biosynthesis